MTFTVDIESTIPDKADQRHPEFARQFHGQTGWSSHRRQEWDTGHQGFLNEFEACPATDKQNTFVER